MNIFKPHGHRWLSVLAVPALTLTALGHAHAGPIAQTGTEGFSVIATGGAVSVTFEGNMGGYTSVLYLGSDTTPLFNNHTTAPGTVVSLGSFAAGTELVFRMHVNDTGDDFYSGPAVRNVDGFAHARAEAEWRLGTTLMSFEDLRGIPEGVGAYNDLSFSIKGVTVSAVPEPTGMALALVGLMGVAGRMGKRRQTEQATTLA